MSASKTTTVAAGVLALAAVGFNPQVKTACAKPRGAAATKPAASIPQAVYTSSKIQGLFYMQKYWIATRYLEKATWYFAPNGKVYVNLADGFSAADLAAHKGDVGAYKVSGGKLSVTWKKNQKSEDKIEIVQGGWNWDTGMYLPIAPFKNAAQAAGAYEGGSSMSFGGGSSMVVKSLELRADGTFSSEGMATFKSDGENTGAAQSVTTGKWTLTGYTMTLKASDGKIVRGIAFPFTEGAKGGKPERIFLPA